MTCSFALSALVPFRTLLIFLLAKAYSILNRGSLYLFHSSFAMFKRAEGTADTQGWSVGTTDDTMWNLLVACADSSKRNVSDIKFARISRYTVNCRNYSSPALTFNSALQKTIIYTMTIEMRFTKTRKKISYFHGANKFFFYVSQRDRKNILYSRRTYNSISVNLRFVNCNGTNAILTLFPATN